VSMEALRTLLSRMGYEDARTLLQSGNVVFRGNAGSASRLESQLEERIAKELGTRTDVFLRTASEWQAILSGNPFRRESDDAPNRLLVTVLKEAPSPARWTELDGAIVDTERVHGAGRHAYIEYPDGVGRSRLTPALIERCLATRGTSRNWNTVTKLGRLASSPEAVA
jgi:uncharacterized protein (DUF1697 family)